MSENHVSQMGGGLCASPVDPAELRRALGRFATGVTVVTTRVPSGWMVGLTVNSFSSVSLDPPLILWSVNRSSSSLAAFQEAGRFAVNVLSEHQRGMAENFCANVSNRFEGIPHESGMLNVPLLPEALAWFECRTVSELNGGDHIILVGEVVEFGYHDDRPLLYYGGRFSVLDRQ